MMILFSEQLLNNSLAQLCWASSSFCPSSPWWPWCLLLPPVGNAVITWSHQKAAEPSRPSECSTTCQKSAPTFNMTILKGDKGDRGDRGTPGDPCKIQYSAFSVGRRKSLHSLESYQALAFDTVFVNLEEHFDMFKGKFICRIPGIYYFNVNIHTWNFKETYLHIMQNDAEKAIVYAQPSDRSIMQSQSVMLELDLSHEVWIRLYKRERENAVYSDDVDVYITFNGYLIKASVEGK
ncbi:Complement C1q tumor necrosis factor-related protein 1 Precursor [Larimichthys crocea]|uniref:Complement C1q tumor necrosis factor-related protein 1 n=1 Tax=Larimichthys crocea TaxID=215358 RepID=A0A6G0HVA7_LARCR|nr:Complement C1q tumor necrosis factor-related protein 1 Precursor [Larimichthys crocea]